MSSENKRKSDLDNQCLESVQKKRKVESLNWDGQGKVECICCKERYERFKSHLNGSPKCKNEYDFEKICKEIETKRKIKNKERVIKKIEQDKEGYNKGRADERNRERGKKMEQDKDCLLYTSAAADE